MTLHEYRYSVLRFVPSIVRDEAVNVGVIVIDDANEATASAFLPDSAPKITALAPGYNVDGIIGAIDTIRRRLDGQHEPAPADAWIRSSEQLRVLAGAMKNQLQLSEPRPWHAASLTDAAQQLYDLHVRPIDAATRPVNVHAVAS
jgi:hypothetical protein